MLCILPFVYVPMPLADLGLVLLIALLAVTAMSLMIRAYTLADAAIVAPMQYSQILWATLFGWLFFAETSLRETGGGTSEHLPVLNNLSRRPEMGGMPRLSLIARKTVASVREQLPRQRH